jgi:hypothetical protein
MQDPKVIKSVIVSGIGGVAMLALLTFAMLTFATPNASATPVLAKGQPCTACHTGTPPSKSNLNDAGKKVQSGLKK